MLTAHTLRPHPASRADAGVRLRRTPAARLLDIDQSQPRSLMIRHIFDGCVRVPQDIATWLWTRARKRAPTSTCAGSGDVGARLRALLAMSESVSPEECRSDRSPVVSLRGG